jgi:hypothetical protein
MPLLWIPRPWPGRSRMDEVAVVDASPLIYLAHANLIDLLRVASPEILVPTAVSMEIRRRGEDDPTVQGWRPLPRSGGGSRRGRFQDGRLGLGPRRSSQGSRRSGRPRGEPGTTFAWRKQGFDSPKIYRAAFALYTPDSAKPLAGEMCTGRSRLCIGRTLRYISASHSCIAFSRESLRRLPAI